jgi:hypothetical protein
MKPSQVTQGSHNGSAHSNSSCSPLSNSSSSSSGSYSIKIGGEEANKTLIDLRNNHLKSYMVVQRAREQSHKQNPNVYRQSQNIQPNLSTLADDSKMKSPDKQTGISCVNCIKKLENFYEKLEILFGYFYCLKFFWGYNLACLLKRSFIICSFI